VPGEGALRSRREERRAAADHANDLDRVAVLEGAALVAVALEDLAVHLDRDGAGVGPEHRHVLEKRSGAFQLDRLAVDPEADHPPKYPMAAKPEAPACKHASARFRSTPPMASTGIRTAAATWRRASSPAAGRPGCEAVAKTGPKIR
jgi:hypothetical protein